MKLPLLLAVYALHPRRLEESLPLSGGVRLEETPVLQLCITDVDVGVFIRDLIRREPVCFSLVDGPAGDQLESAGKVRRPRGRRAMQTNIGMKCTHFVFQRLHPLFSQSFSEPLSAPVPLLQCVLRHRVSLEGAVPPHHAQGGASVAGHTGEALAAWEAEHCHLVKAHVALHTCELWPLHDGANWSC